MALLERLTKDNFVDHPPFFPVYDYWYNELVDLLNTMAPNGIPAADTITELSAGSGVTVDGVLLKDSGISLTSTVVEYTKLVTLTAAEIVGTAAGDLGHSAGAILVAAPASEYALEFVSAVLIYDFDTAAYTGGAGDDLVIRVGTTSVSPVVATADLITAAGDQVVHLRALAAADYDLPVGSTINLKSTEVTQPGTAAGVIRVHITYRVHTTGL